jgi:hypothetical protein
MKTKAFFCLFTSWGTRTTVRSPTTAATTPISSTTKTSNLAVLRALHFTDKLNQMIKQTICENMPKVGLVNVEMMNIQEFTSDWITHQFGISLLQLPSKRMVRKSIG